MVYLEVDWHESVATSPDFANTEFTLNCYGPGQTNIFEDNSFKSKDEVLAHIFESKVDQNQEDLAEIQQVQYKNME